MYLPFSIFVVYYGRFDFSVLFAALLSCLTYKGSGLKNLCLT